MNIYYSFMIYVLLKCIENIFYHLCDLHFITFHSVCAVTKNSVLTEIVRTKFDLLVLRLEVSVNAELEEHVFRYLFRYFFPSTIK